MTTTRQLKSWEDFEAAVECIEATKGPFTLNSLGLWYPLAYKAMDFMRRHGAVRKVPESRGRSSLYEVIR